jgi:hypothetical protein
MNLESRQKEKAESRKRDKERLDSGEDPYIIQKEYSIFPDAYFKDCKIQNLKDAVGK